jgi:TolA-binding protein
MSAKKRIRKHDLKEDRFVTATFQLTTYVRERQNTFLAILAAVVVAVIIVAVVTSSRSRTQEAVGQLLGEAHTLYQMGNYQEAIQRCQSVLDQFGKTQQADMAAFLLADSYLKLGDYEKSIEFYQLYVDKYHGDQLLTASSLTGIAVCHEQLNRYAQAAEFYQRAATRYPDYFAAPEALLNAGRCYVLAGQDDKARVAYQDLIEKYPESRYLNDAKVAAAELGGT